MAHEWVPKFLESLTRTPNVAEACREAGITRKAAYDHRNSDEEFAGLWDAAVEQSTDELVGEAYRRARKGTVEPVYYKGNKVGKIRRYSDALTIFLLKCHRRKVYGDKLETDVTTAGQAIQTIFYFPENGRDGNESGADPEAPAGPPDDVPRDPG